ncbi:MAG: glycosyltransferase family 4 protein [Prolixibacteraceae bacterium]
MKLIFLVADLHLWGGGERVAVLMANHYVAKGIEVTLLSVGKPDGDFRFVIDPRVKVDYLSVNLKSGWKLFRKIESIIATRRFFKAQRTRQKTAIAPGIKNPNNRSFLLSIGNYPIILSALVPRSEQLKTIGCLHSQYHASRHIWKFLRWLLYPRLDLLVSLTQKDLPRLKKHNPQVRVIPNPLTFYPEQPAELKNKIILAVGRIDFLKGYDLMLEVFERFCRTNPDWHLRIIGDGPLKAEIERIAEKKGLSDRFTIFPASNNIEKEYLEASIFLMTSRSEGLPMVLLEAQACGLPIIAFDCETGPAEIIHHYNSSDPIPKSSDGFVIRPSSPVGTPFNSDGSPCSSDGSPCSSDGFAIRPLETTLDSCPDGSPCSSDGFAIRPLEPAPETPLEPCPDGPSSDGFVIRSFDINEMTTKLLELTFNPALRKSLSTAARQNVKRFLPEIVFRQWDEVFQTYG